MLDRRLFVASAVGSAWALAGCQPPDPTTHITGQFTGIDHARGHWLRDALQAGKPWPAPAQTHKTRVLIAGGGVAGLAAARALRLQGVDDYALLELEDTAGGNSRGGQIAGLACPLGAHYLPAPGDDAPEVQDLMEELGLRQRVSGRWQYDERHLCHSPQERLFFQGNWQEGLLPVQGVGPGTRIQYQKFANLVEQARKTDRWTIPVQKGPAGRMQQAQAAITFIAFLDQNGLDDPHLRWYLDYCCKDDYGAGIATVSAWAGLHYFASRHGFHAPVADGSAGAEHPGAEREGVLTWPEGNAWLTRRLAAPLGERLHTGRVVLRITNTRSGVEVDAWNTANQNLERWQAERAIVALPIFVAARVVQNPPDFLRRAAQRLVYAPWLVANIHIAAPLHDRPGAPPSWDNVLYSPTVPGSAPVTGGLGYVDAQHQSLNVVPGATVLTHYRALGDVPGGPGGPAAGRKLLLEQPWSVWRDTILAELGQAHPDLAAKTRQIDLTRYGHAMAIPLPQADGQIGHWPSQDKHGQLSKKEQYPSRAVARWERLHFAHSDWAGYSVFEEAFTAGHTAAGV